MLNPHTTLFKNRGSKLDTDGFRQRRIEEGQSIRKERREDELTRQRSFSATVCPDIDELMECITDDVDLMEVNNNEQNSPVKQESIKLLFSENVYDQLGAAEKFARLVIRKPETSTTLIEMGLVPRFFQLLQKRENALLQSKTMLVLTNLTTQTVNNALPANFVDIITETLESKASDQVTANTITTLANIVIESAELRDHVLISLAWPTLLSILNCTTKFQLLHAGVFALRNFTSKMKSPPDFSLVSMCLPILARLIHHEDYDIISSACLALGYIADISVQAVIDTDVCPRLVQLLCCRSSNMVVAAAVYAVGVVVGGDLAQTQTMIDLNVLPALYQLLDSDKPNIVEKACWVISTIGAGTSDQIQYIIKGGFIQKLLELLIHSDDMVRAEAAYGIRRCISRTRTLPVQIDSLVSIGIVQTLSGLLTSTDSKVLHTALRALKVILDLGGSKYFSEFEQYGEFLNSLKN